MWAITPNITKLIILPPKVACAPTNLPTKTPGADMGALSMEVILLQEEMNNVMGHLPLTRASIVTHSRKQVWDFEMAINQNEAKATKAIREAKAYCGAAIREAETCYGTTVRESEGHCPTTITEAEAYCAADIRKVESHCVDHAHAIQQSHINNMQHLEREAIEEEGENCQSFLATCRRALKVCPPEVWGVLICPLQLLMENMSFPTLLSIPPDSNYQGGIDPCNFLYNHPCSTCALP